MTWGHGWLKVSRFHFVFSCLEKDFLCLSSFCRSARSWAGATRSQYGPFLHQLSEPLQLLESNTWPSTKETQQGRTTGGNCSPNISDEFIKHAERAVCVCAPVGSTQAFYVVLHQYICRNVSERWRVMTLMLFGKVLMQETVKWCSGSVPAASRSPLRAARLVSRGHVMEAFILTCLPPSQLSQ